MIKKAPELASRYGRKANNIQFFEDILNEKYHVNAFSNPLFPIITSDIEIQFFRWGLIPHWTKTEEDACEVRKINYNARAENIFEKPSFRTVIKSQRCIVPSTGYYEWRYEDDRRIPYFIYVTGEDIFSIAGIYDVWTDEETGNDIYTFSVITTEANTLTSYIQNTKQRMPLILPKEQEYKWLNPDLTESEITDMLIPFDEKNMDAFILRDDFMKKNPYDNSILERV